MNVEDSTGISSIEYAMSTGSPSDLVSSGGFSVVANNFVLTNNINSESLLITVNALSFEKLLLYLYAAFELALDVDPTNSLIKRELQTFYLSANITNPEYVTTSYRNLPSQVLLSSNLVSLINSDVSVEVTIQNTATISENNDTFSSHLVTTDDVIRTDLITTDNTTIISISSVIESLITKAKTLETIIPITSYVANKCLTIMGIRSVITNVIDDQFKIYANVCPISSDIEYTRSAVETETVSEMITEVSAMTIWFSTITTISRSSITFQPVVTSVYQGVSPLWTPCCVSCL